jgi:hypothetical protein
MDAVWRVCDIVLRKSDSVMVKLWAEVARNFYGRVSGTWQGKVVMGLLTS